MSDTPKSMEKIRTPSISRKKIEAALNNNEGIQFKYPGNCNQISLPIKLFKKIFLMLKPSAFHSKDAVKQALANKLGEKQFGNMYQKL